MFPNRTMASFWQICLLSFCMLCFSLTGLSAGEKVTITALPGAGLFIQCGKSGILIDALVDPHETEGDTLLTHVRNDILSRSDVFSSVNLVLFSHLHHEHFHPATAATFIQNNPGVMIASSENIINAVKQHLDKNDRDLSHVQSFTVERGKVDSRTIAGISIDVLPLDHVASMLYHDTVLSYIIYLPGKTVLCIGDAEMDPDNWKEYHVREKKIDIAVVPYWLYANEQARSTIGEFINPANVVAIGVPPAGRTLPKEKHPSQFADNVRLLTHVLESVSF